MSVNPTVWRFGVRMFVPDTASGAIVSILSFFFCFEDAILIYFKIPLILYVYIYI